jgi:hypothetical protein
VVPAQQPGLSLVPINMVPDVAAMVESVTA